MNLPLPTMLHFLFFPPSAARLLRRHRPTLSPTNKKTNLSGWLPLPPAYLPAPHRSGLPSNSSFLTPPLTPLAYANSK